MMDYSEVSPNNESSDLFSKYESASYQLLAHSKSSNSTELNQSTKDQSSDLFANNESSSNENVLKSEEKLIKEIQQDNNATEQQLPSEQMDHDNFVEKMKADENMDTCTPADNDVISEPPTEYISVQNSSPLSSRIDEAVQQAYIDSIRSPQETRVIDWNHDPKMIAFSEKEFSHTANNYLRGCKWAPDSSCLLTNSNDNILRIFNFPQQFFDHSNRDPLTEEMESVVKIREHELIYDYCWYPLMNSHDPVSCCIASCSRANPVNLWDAFTGQKRATYRSFNHLDELEAPYSVAFSIDGCKLFCGFNKCIRIFDVDRPGKECEVRPKLGKKSPQRGILSCLAMHPTKRHVYACGSYNRTIGLYSEPGSLMTLLRGQQGGVTHLSFSPDGVLLASGGRKDAEILIWDIRQPGRILMSLIRNVGTNQRIYFEFDDSGQFLLSGSHSGQLFCYKIGGSPGNSDEVCHCPSFGWQAHSDVCNGVSINRWAGDIVATCSGQRHISLPYLNVSDSSDDDDTDIDSNSDSKQQNGLTLWSFYSRIELL